MSNKTPLFNSHERLGAKIIDFAGYSMPVWYKGIKDEYEAVRQRIGIFDINHMGEITITGPDRNKILNYAITNDLEKIDIDKVMYTYICGSDGKILDDLLVMLFSDMILLIVNAGQSKHLVEHIKNNKGSYHFEIDDDSQKTGALSIQGPMSFDLCKKVFGEDLNQIDYYSFKSIEYNGEEIIISRTGYTGEKGFEIFFNTKLNEQLWDLLLKEGEKWGILPCGLAVRDVLRLEMGYPLYGNDLKGFTPYELNKKFFVSIDKEDFIGKQILLNQKEKGFNTTLKGFIMTEKGIPRHGYKIFKNNKEIGYVTSGGYSPGLDNGIGLAYIETSESKNNSEIDIQIRDKFIKAKCIKTPFIPTKVK